MRLILDTNQVRHVVRTSPTNEFSPTFVLPPLVIAELARNSRNAAKDAKALAKYDLLFGADVIHFMNYLSLVPEETVSTSVPVYMPLTRSYQKLRKGFLRPTDKYRRRANQLKKEADQSAKEVLERAKRESLEHHKMRSRGERPKFVRWTTIEDAEAMLYPDVNSTWAQETLSMVTSEGQHPIKCQSEDTLWDAMRANHHVRLWMRVAITQFFGYRQVWRDKQLNVDPQGNDITDITLPLYARPGDVILTNDKKLKRSIKHSDPDGTVRVMTWEEYLQWRERGFD